MKKYLLFLSVIFLTGCLSEPEALDYALYLAGDNRPELEKVLQHYQDDSLKWKAARFLIENMPASHSYDSWQIDSMKAAKVTAIAHKGFINPATKKKWAQFSYHTLPKIKDIQVINADYLIRNIDQAFRVWREKPWNRTLSFDEFCELILPYRIADEPLEDWRTIYYNRYNPILDSLYQGTDIVEAASRLCAYMSSEGFQYNEDFNLPHLGASYLLKHRVGSCQESCDFCIYVMRALGFPTAIDIYPYSPEFQGGHLWNVLRDTNGTYVPFWFIQTGVQRGGHDGRKKGKVYRKCFGIQPEIYPGIRKEKHVPQLFRSLRQKEVTSDYFGKNQISIPLEEPRPDLYAYLGVFTSRGWLPIAIGKIQNLEAIFQNLEPDVVYQPMCIDQKGKHNIYYPFRMDKEGKVHYFIPDTSKTTFLTIHRKYPLRPYMFNYMCEIMNGRIEGSMTQDFRNHDLLYQIIDTPRTNFCPVFPKPTGPYRYLRFHSDKHRPVQIAELFLYNDSLAAKPLRTCISEASPSYAGNEQMNAYKANDGNILTYYLSQDTNAYITYELEKPEHIRKLVYVPRNDDNFIRQEYSYKLFYQNGSKGWCLWETQKAESSSLHFNHIPRNALFWLHLNKGKEERIFIVKNGEPLFL